MAPDLHSRLDSARLYLCTDARKSTNDFHTFVAAAFSGGVDIIQLRDKSLDAAEELRLLETLAEIAVQHDALWAVNDRADIAAIAGAPIVHVGQDDLSAGQVRQIVGSELAVGRSSHSLKEATAEAADPKVDYFAVGPCWPTPTKPGRPAPGLGLVGEVAALEVVKPWFAIGGIDSTNLDQVLAAGATRIVVVRAITHAENPERAAAELRSKLNL